MAIESPSTYAEWYWANSVEASRFRSEEYEKTLAPIASAIIAGLPNLEKLPPAIHALLTAISTPTAPDLDNVLFRFLAQVGGGVAQRILNHEIKDFDYALNSYLKNTRITPDVANILMLRKKITEDFWVSRQAAAGFSEVEAAFQYESSKPYPSMPDIISYARYKEYPNTPKETAWKLFDISPSDWDLWEWLSRQKPTTEQVQSLYRRKTWNPFRTDIELGRLGWLDEDKEAVLDLAYSLPNAMLLTQGALLQNADDRTILENISKADIHPLYAKTYLDGILTKPATNDIITYELRRNPSLTNLDSELRKIGVHPNYYDLYRELAFPIPPVADIITMAVREAFTPDIAARFGQYEGLPTDFVEWVGKKGISKQWAERYWAAHWSLPSPQQGFEMLHRGIITHDDLMLLLRALDIMPFWRDKLIQMAYTPLTRVDVRRMFGLGVLDEDGVLKAYTDLGYNETNAKLMKDFTIQQTRRSVTKFTSSNVITAFTKRLIDEAQARSLLRNIGIKDKEIPNIIETANYKREWAIKEDKLAAIENLYKKNIYSESQTRTELSRLDFPSDHITTLLNQWQLKAEADKQATWTAAQTLTFLKRKLIDENRARKELDKIGYDTEHINIYIKSATTETAE